MQTCQHYQILSKFVESFGDEICGQTNWQSLCGGALTELIESDKDIMNIQCNLFFQRLKCSRLQTRDVWKIQYRLLTPWVAPSSLHVSAYQAWRVTSTMETSWSSGAYATSSLESVFWVDLSDLCNLELISETT